MSKSGLLRAILAYEQAHLEADGDVPHNPASLTPAFLSDRLGGTCGFTKILLTNFFLFTARYSPLLCVFLTLKETQHEFMTLAILVAKSFYSYQTNLVFF
jgi:hypothetical protein